MSDPKDPPGEQQRLVLISGLGEGRGDATASLSVWRRYDVLLDTAKKLRDAGYPEAAIVIAQTACEVCTERVMADALAAKGAPPSKLRMSNYNLDRKKVRERYAKLIGHRIHEDAPDRWRTFEEHVKRRHDVAHRGHAATVEQADASIEAVEYIIGRLLGNSL